MKASPNSTALGHTWTLLAPFCSAYLKIPDENPLETAVTKWVPACLFACLPVCLFFFFLLFVLFFLFISFFSFVLLLSFIMFLCFCLLFLILFFLSSSSSSPSSSSSCSSPSSCCCWCWGWCSWRWWRRWWRLVASVPLSLSLLPLLFFLVIAISVPVDLLY